MRSSATNKSFKEQEQRLKKLNEKLAKLRLQRNSEKTRLNNHLNLESELKSLNRAISLGKVSCNDCGSENITYKSKDIIFDVSNKEVRASILQSLQGNIDLKKELISRIDYDLSALQDEIGNELSQVSPELRDIILFQDELDNSGSLDKELATKQRDIERLTQSINDATSKQEGLSDKQKQFLNGIVKAMNDIYKLVDETGVQTFTDLFTKKSVNYSGSEEQEFYFAKLYALFAVLKHEFPIVIDSFRDRELSSLKEQKMIEVFEALGTQVIVTSTLKKEEYSSDKYKTYGSLNAIDYSSHTDSRILKESFRTEFLAICSEFGAIV